MSRRPSTPQARANQALADPAQTDPARTASARNAGVREGSAEAPLRIGVSDCLTGAAVRWDGGHQRDGFVCDVLGRFVEFVPVCPEVASGLGVPRETLRLVGDPAQPRLVFRASGSDHTAALEGAARELVARLASLDLCGFILKKESPSCGMERVRVYPLAGGSAQRRGVGLFARRLMEALPLLPVEEDGRLNDPLLRETFVERIFAYRRWRDFLEGGFTLGSLVRFHSAHKYLLLAHSPELYASLGRSVARGKEMPRAQLLEEYGSGFMRAMAVRATVGKHVNVLQHMAGYFKDRLSSDARAELSEVIADYRARLVPLLVPVTLMRHHVRTLGEPYLSGQVYLEPNPKELLLRNHV